MLNAILHKGLGATTSSRSGTVVTSSRGATALTYSSWMQKFTNDPFKSMVTVGENNIPVVVISDGATTWNVDLGDGKSTVSQALHNFFTKYNRYDLLPVQNTDGSYARGTSYGKRSSSTGAYDPFEQKKQAAKEDAKQAQLDKDAYNVALQNKTLRTLNEILSSNNVAAKLFYIPYGYYYIGNSVAVSPYADYDAAAAAKNAGDNYSNNVRNSTTTTTTTTPTTTEKDNTTLYLLLALFGIVIYKKFIKR